MNSASSRSRVIFFACYGNMNEFWFLGIVCSSNFIVSFADIDRDRSLLIRSKSTTDRIRPIFRHSRCALLDIVQWTKLAKDPCNPERSSPWTCTNGRMNLTRSGSHQDRSKIIGLSIDWNQGLIDCNVDLST